MQRAVRRAVLAAATLGCLAGFLLLIPTGPSGAATAPDPATTSSSAPALLNVNLLGVRLSVKVPLVTKLLGGGGTAPTETSPAPQPTPKPTPTSRAPQPHTSAPAPAGDPSAQPRNSSPRLGTDPTQAAAAGPRNRRPDGPPASTARPDGKQQTSSAHVSSAQPQPRRGLTLTKRLLPGTDTVLLTSLLIATALGVGLVVRLSGRRGGHEA